MRKLKNTTLGGKNMAEKFYVTTPIYYPSGKFHIGTAYTTTLANTIKNPFYMSGLFSNVIIVL